MQNRAERKHIAPQPGQLLWVEAMSKPHSGQKRPPDCPLPQFGQRIADEPVAAAALPDDAPCVARPSCCPAQSSQRPDPASQHFSHTVRSHDGQTE